MDSFQFVNYPHTMWAKDADGNSILQIKSESDQDPLSQATIKQVRATYRSQVSVATSFNLFLNRWILVDKETLHQG